MPKLLEKHVEQPTVDRARKLGILVVKQTHAGARSHPDRAFYFPGGALLQIEFKAPGEIPTKLQAQTIQQLRGLGFEVQVIDDRKQGIALVEHVAKHGLPSPSAYNGFTQKAVDAALAKAAPVKKRRV
jgi:hypothetical protein